MYSLLRPMAYPISIQDLYHVTGQYTPIMPSTKIAINEPGHKVISLRVNGVG